MTLTDDAREFLIHINVPPLWAQALNVVGEAGEFAEAYRRYTGHARRASTIDEVQDELADVIIAASCMAVMLGFTVEDICDRKWSKIFARGYGNQIRTDDT